MMNSWHTGQLINLFCSFLLLFFLFVCFFFFFFFFWKEFFQEYTIAMPNSLNPDKAGGFVRPDLGPNCLPRLSAYDIGRQRV